MATTRSPSARGMRRTLIPFAFRSLQNRLVCGHRPDLSAIRVLHLPSGDAIAPGGGVGQTPSAAKAFSDHPLDAAARGACAGHVYYSDQIR